MARGTSTRSVTVAIVEDDAAIRDSIRLVLENYGWIARTYADGETFLVDNEFNNVDCVVLDPHLPGLSGAAVARELTGSSPRIPIIGLTARPHSTLSNDVAATGAFVILTKPVSETTLLGHIESAIKK